MSERGEVVVSRQYDPINGRDVLRIDRADPRALISPELLEEIREGYSGPWAVLNGDVLTLSDDYGQRFIYRIGERIQGDPWSPAYEMEWPD